jgi:hypothetical protein
MPTPNYSFVLSAQLVSATTCSVGDVMIPSADVAGRWVVATEDNRGTRGSEAIALTAYGGAGTGSIQIQQAGVIDADISGLAAGDRAVVRCSSTGTIERVASPTSDDDVIGYAEADGRVHLHFGIPWNLIAAGGAVPGGSTASVQVNNGSGAFTGYSTVLAGSGYISIGTTPATTGPLRLPYGSDGAIYGRNFADDGNIRLISSHLFSGEASVRVGGSNASIWLDAGTGLDVHISGDIINFRDGASSSLWASLSDTAFELNEPLWLLDSAGFQYYKFVPSNLAAHRNVTLPLLASDDTFVFAAHIQTLTNKTLTAPVITSPTITGSPGASVAMGALEVNWAAGNVFTKTLAAGGNTITFANSADGQTIVVILTGAASTVTWPSVEWAGGTPPVQTASGVDVWTFVKAGSVVYGSVVQNLS